MDGSITACSLLRQYKYQWDRKKVLTLINGVEEFFDDFYDESKKKKHIWNDIAKYMKGKGYSCSGLECDKKWRNLKGTYYNVLQNYVPGESKPRFEFFNALHHILGREIYPDELSDQIIKEEETTVPIEDDTFEDLENDGGLVWGPREVNLLLGYIMECQSAFATPSAVLSTVWKDIARQMTQVGEDTVSSEQCQRKWLNLKKGLRAHQVKEESEGVASLWPYHAHTLDVVKSVDVRTTIKGENEATQKHVKAHKQSSKSIGCSPSKVTTSAGKEKTVLSHVKRIKSSFKTEQRLKRLEMRIDSSWRCQEVTKYTNVLLLQVLAELRRINGTLRESVPGSGAILVSQPDHSGT